MGICIHSGMHYFPNGCEKTQYALNLIELFANIAQDRTLVMRMKNQPRHYAPLHMAAIRGDIELLRKLILVEDRNELDDFGRNATMWTMQKGHPHVVHFLLPGTNLLVQDSRGGTALQTGVHHDQAECVRVLVRAAAHFLGDDEFALESVGLTLGEFCWAVY